MRVGDQYWVAVAVGAGLCVLACALARRYPGRPARFIGRAISIVMAGDAVVFVVYPLFSGGWTVAKSLPLNLCDLTLVIAAITCWAPRWQLGVELTYFWGMAGSLQAVATPDLSYRFPRVEFFEFVIGHLGIVIAALYLVVGLRLAPRRGSVPRVLAITAGYTVAAGMFDWATGANYMYLARIPKSVSLLSVLGPWPWYVVSAAGVAVVLFVALDVPFRLRVTSPSADTSRPARRP